MYLFVLKVLFCLLQIYFVQWSTNIIWPINISRCGNYTPPIRPLGRYVYMTELVFELSELVIDMVHHIHMLVWGNMFLTMASLVICMQLRLLFYQLQHKVKSHRNYLRVLQLMNMWVILPRVACQRCVPVAYEVLQSLWLGEQILMIW